jgi:hypothetical protein
MVWRIEIGGDQMQMLREMILGRAQYAGGGQLLEISRRDLKFDLGLDAHGADRPA